ncbi:35384_t:CDS:1, partial [Racocetra persica]
LSALAHLLLLVKFVEFDVEEDESTDKSDENEKTDESDDNEALLNQEYLFYEMQPILDRPAKLCGRCMKKGHDAVNCALEKEWEDN